MNQSISNSKDLSSVYFEEVNLNSNFIQNTIPILNKEKNDLKKNNEKKEKKKEEFNFEIGLNLIKDQKKDIIENKDENTNNFLLDNKTIDLILNANLKKNEKTIKKISSNIFMEEIKVDGKIFFKEKKTKKQEISYLSLHSKNESFLIQKEDLKLILQNTLKNDSKNSFDH